MRKRLPWLLFVLACAVGIGVYNPFLLAELALLLTPATLAALSGIRLTRGNAAVRARRTEGTAPRLDVRSACVVIVCSLVGLGVSFLLAVPAIWLSVNVVNAMEKLSTDSLLHQIGLLLHQYHQDHGRL